MFVLKMIWKTACDRDECELAEVCPEVRRLLPEVMSFKTSSTELTTLSVNPTTTTCCLPSSKTLNFDFPESRSKTWKKFFVKSTWIFSNCVDMISKQFWPTANDYFAVLGHELSLVVVNLSARVIWGYLEEKNKNVL